MTPSPECHHKVPGNVGDSEVFTAPTRCHVTEKDSFLALAQDQLVPLPDRIVAASNLCATGRARREILELPWTGTVPAQNKPKAKHTHTSLRLKSRGHCLRKLSTSLPTHMQDVSHVDNCQVVLFGSIF